MWLLCGFAYICQRVNSGVGKGAGVGAIWLPMKKGDRVCYPPNIKVVGQLIYIYKVHFHTSLYGCEH